MQAAGLRDWDQEGRDGNRERAPKSWTVGGHRSREPVTGYWWEGGIDR